MFTALVFAFLSAVCMALMVVTDRLMVGDCYRGKPNHAWFVSSLAGSVFGLILTGALWLFLSTTEKVSIAELLELASGLFLWKGLAAVLVGALGVQILLHYFRCFGEEAHSSVISAWIASTPIFVFLLMLVFPYILPIEGVSTTSTEPMWVFGILLATAGLILFERVTGGPAGNVGVYRRELVLLILLNVVYTVALKQVFSIEAGEDGLTEAIALMPFYWLGFGAGMRVMLKKEERRSFRSNWRTRIRYFLVPILFVEVVGMLVFFFEYLSLTRLDPTLVTIIVGSHVLLVYVLDLLLGWTRAWMEKRGIHRMYILGIRLLQKKLPEPKFESDLIAAEVLIIIGILIGIGLVLAVV